MEGVGFSPRRIHVAGRFLNRPMKTPLMLALLGLSIAAALGETPAAFTQSGVASWYAESRRTASGEHYDASSLTAAHRTLPFGTKVCVQNLANGRSVTVLLLLRINNRGPFCKKRIIDLSKAAAKELEIMQSGTARVQLVVVE